MLKSLLLAVALAASVRPALAQPADTSASASPAARRLAEAAAAARVETIFDRPAAAMRARVFGGVTYERTADGRAIWMHDPDEAYGVAAPQMSGGAQLWPVIDAFWLDDHDDIDGGPTTVAFVVPGASHAWIQGAAVPLVRAPGTSIDDRGARAATVGLRARATCPGVTGSCVMYGPPADVLAAREPLEASRGWTLETLAPAKIPERMSFRARHDTRGAVALASDRWEPRIVEGDWSSRLSPHRVWVVVGERRVHAFDIAFANSFAGGDHHLVPWGNELLVVVGDGTHVGVSRHDARTGERIGEPVLVRSHSHFHVCDDSDVLYPVPTRRAMGFALVNRDFTEEAVYFPTSRSAGRIVDVERRRGEEEATPERYALAERGLRPVFDTARIERGE